MGLGRIKKNRKTRKNQNQKKKETPQWLISTMVCGGYIIGAIVLIALLWIPGRWISYKTKYESQVKKAIIEMVKPEALKEKYKDETHPQKLKDVIEK